MLKQTIAPPQRFSNPSHQKYENPSLHYMQILATQILSLHANFAMGLYRKESYLCCALIPTFEVVTAEDEILAGTVKKILNFRAL